LKAASRPPTSSKQLCHAVFPAWHKLFYQQITVFQLLQLFPKKCNHISFLFGKAMFAVVNPPKTL